MLSLDPLTGACPITFAAAARRAAPARWPQCSSIPQKIVLIPVPTNTEEKSQSIWRNVCNAAARRAAEARGAGGHRKARQLQTLIDREAAAAVSSINLFQQRLNLLRSGADAQVGGEPELVCRSRVHSNFALALAHDMALPRTRDGAWQIAAANLAQS